MENGENIFKESLLVKRLNRTELDPELWENLEVNLPFSFFINKGTSSTSILVIFLCVMMEILSHANQRSQDVLHHMDRFQSFLRAICLNAFLTCFLAS